MNRKPKPIAIIGAGNIVEHAHLPAYKRAGFEVVAIADTDPNKAQRLAGEYNILRTFPSITDVVEAYGNQVIYDIAVPAKLLTTVVSELPDMAHALLQKPMGENLEQATEIRTVLDQKNCCAGVNFQLRYAPVIQVAHDFIESGKLGELVDAEVYVNVFTPWHIWDFLFKADRVELLYHSIHYLDLFRYVLGEPKGLFAKSTADPRYPHLTSIRSSIILDYGNQLRTAINTNHTHPAGSPYHEAFIRFEGTKGMLRIQLGILLNYPDGRPDRLEFLSYDADPKSGWQQLSVSGNWFPDAFIGSMNEIRKASNDLDYKPTNGVRDAWFTMYWVEEAYRQSAINENK